MPVTETIKNYLSGEGQMIKSAPASFIAAVAGVAVVIWLAMGWRYGGIIENKDSEISTLKTERDAYKTKSGGASPDEVKAKLAELSEITKQTVGNPWRPLTAQEKAKLQNAAKSIPPRFINVMYSNFRGKDLAQSFAEALKAAGWDQVNLGQSVDLGYGLSVGWGNGPARNLKEAIETATNMKVEHKDPDLEDQQNLGLFLSVGVNLN